MASRIKAIGEFRPRIQLGETAQKGELVELVASRSGQNEGTIDLGIKELRDSIIFILRRGRAVKIEGLGIWTPNIGLDGTLDVQYRQDPDLKNGLNAPGTFLAPIKNRENIGKTPDELIALWNEAHPEDPVV